jgi:two-component system NtrC family sensor kinase
LTRSGRLRAGARPRSTPARRTARSDKGTSLKTSRSSKNPAVVISIIASLTTVAAITVAISSYLSTPEGQDLDLTSVYVGAALISIPLLCAVLIMFAIGKNVRRDLSARRERYYALFEGSHDGQAVLDGDRFEEINARGCEIARLPRGAIIGKTPADLAPPTQADGRASAAVAREKILAALEGEPQRFEWRFIRGDGALMDAVISLAPIDFDSKRRLLLSLQDVSQRKKTAQHRQRLQAVLESTVDAVGIADAAGRMTYMNAAARRLLGLGPDDDPSNITELTATRDGDALLATAAREGSWTDEVMLRRPDGDSVPVSQAIVAHHDSTGAIAFYSTIIRDLSGRKANERQTQSLATAIGQISEGILITDAGGEIEYVNQAMTKITGYTADELLGKNPRLLKSGHHGAGFYRGMWETIGRGEIWSGRLVNQRKDGSLYQEEMTVTPIRGDDGAIQSYVGAKRDITDEVLLETQLHQAQKMEAIGQLAGGVAHDFNNMLTGITGYAQLLLRGAQSESERVDLRQILDLSHRAADLTRQLLAFSRRQQLEKANVDLNDLVGNTMKMLGRLIPESIETVFDGADDLDSILADSGQMVQVVMNLAVNARDSMPDGGKLLIETANTHLDATYASEHIGVEPGRYVMLSVTDTGVGMDADTQQHIFEPFFTTKRAGEGTGLGLATVYGIVKQHGGHLSVDSEPGTGTVFRVLLPATESASQGAGRGEEFHPEYSETSTVLLVEDETAVREIVERTLGEIGCHVLSAGRSSEARVLFDASENGIDLLLTDVVMPGGLGTELFNELHALDPDLKVLFMSGYPDRGAAQLADLPDGSMFLQKPFTPSKLAERVRSILQS